MRTPAVIATVAVVLAAALAAAIFVPYRETSRSENRSDRVAATIFPIYDIARNVAAGAIAVDLILPPGAEPHSYEPPPSIARQLAGASAVYAVGHGFDDWIDPLIPADAAKVVVDAGIVLRASEEPEEHGPFDPHFWLTIPNAKRIATTIARDLEARFPAQERVLRANLARYLDELDAADASVRTAIGGAANTNVVMFHDAWEYFAAEYGLDIVATFEPSPGREPTPGHLAAIAEAAKDAGVRTLYAEALFSDAAVRAFAADNGLTISTLDDIGGGPGRETYIDLLESNARTIAQNQ